ncbi:MAG: tripartite tricarboxylate transporter permease [Candidatus Atribacteria bacterium]|nr:tripartite tricarboxylate transporter permease [Candidatus Atribacteria bacterium]
MENLWLSIIHLLTSPNIILTMFISTTIGIIIGALPGLTATMAIAILVGLTYSLSTDMCFAIIMSVYVGAIYGGSITAILLNIPGTGSAAATALDGYPLAVRGEANFAIGITRTASFFGTIFGLIMLLTIAPQLAKIALLFTSVEISLLALFGVLVSGFVAAEDLKIKGWISAFLGMLVSCVGIDLLHAYPRFTFNNPMMMSGIFFVPAMIGVFSIPQVLDNLRLVLPPRMKQTGSIMPKWSQISKYIPLSLRSGVIGTAIGIIPGAGEDIGAWMAYFAAKSTSREKEKFGKGSIEGIVAAETGNNAAIGGALIPLLTLSIPGSPPAAVLLGAFLLHGIRPGPMLMFEFPEFLQQLGSIMLVVSFILLISGILVAKFFIKALDIPPKILMPIVAVLSVIGAYAIHIRIFDVYVMLFLGVCYYFLFKVKYPVAPFVLGVILGPMIDENLRRAFWVHGGLLPVLTRPIALVLFVGVILLILFQFSWFQKLFTKKV